MNYPESIAQCVYTEGQAFMMKIPTAYHEAPTTKFRLFSDAESWDFSNHKSEIVFCSVFFL